MDYPEIGVDLTGPASDAIAKSGMRCERLMRVMEATLVNKDLKILRVCKRGVACLTIDTHT